MRIKKLILTTAIFLAIPLILPAATAAAAPTISLDIKDSFGSGEEIKFSYSISSTETLEIQYVVGVECETAPIPLLELKDATISPYSPISDTYTYLTVDPEIGPQKCTARVSVAEPNEVIEEKEFTITNKPVAEFEVKTCKDKDCNQPSTVFIKDEKVYITYTTEQEGLTVSTDIETPSGEKSALSIPGSYSPEELGTFIITADAESSEYNKASTTRTFAVIEKAPEIAISATCNGDGKCDSGENPDNCPQDCSKSDLTTQSRAVQIAAIAIIVAGILTIPAYFLFKNNKLCLTCKPKKGKSPDNQN